MRTLFFLVTLSILKLVCCSNESPSPVLGLPTTVTENGTSIKGQDADTKIPSDSRSQLLNLEGNPQNMVKSCKVEVNTVLGRPEMLEVRFQRNSNQSLFQCKFSNPSYILDSDDNDLKTLSPEVFDRLEEIVALLLEHNNLDSLNVRIPQDSDFLETLEIDQNNLLILPNEIFRGLIHLETIILNGNKFSVIPMDLFVHNKRLRTVKLMQNQIKIRQLPQRLFSSFADLKVVTLQDIGLQQVTEELFWASYRMKELDLSKNYLKTLPECLLRDARELRILNVSSNHLTTLPNDIFSTANQLNQLDLSKNDFTVLNSFHLFANLHGLKLLNMEDNKLKFIHADALISLSKLKVAKFSQNYLNLSTGLHDPSGQASPFHHCHSLEELYLSNNSVSKMYSDWILNHTQLRKLDLSHNRFSYLEANDLLFNSSDLYVNLSNNFITIVNLTQLSRIRPRNVSNSRNVVVNLNFNPIDCSCAVHSLERYGIRKITNYITQEDLDYLKLEIDDLFCDAPVDRRGEPINQLEDQMLNHKRPLSCSIESGTSKHCASVEGCFCYITPTCGMLVLDCSGRNLTVAPSWINSWHVHEAWLRFSDNALRRTPDVTRGGYEDISRLYLNFSRNAIDELQKTSVNENVHGIYLDHNNITKIDLEIVRFLATKTRAIVTSLFIRENPWPCNQQTLEFRDYARGYFGQGYWDMGYFTCNDTATESEFRQITVN